MQDLKRDEDRLLTNKLTKSRESFWKFDTALLTLARCSSFKSFARYEQTLAWQLLLNYLMKSCVLYLSIQTGSTYRLFIDLQMWGLWKYGWRAHNGWTRGYQIIAARILSRKFKKSLHSFSLVIEAVTKSKHVMPCTTGERLFSTLWANPLVPYDADFMILCGLNWEDVDQN